MERDIVTLKPPVERFGLRIVNFSIHGGMDHVEVTTRISFGAALLAA